MGFWNDVSPTRAVKDLALVWKGNPYRWRALAAAAFVSGSLLYLAIPDSQRIAPPRPQVTFITSFAPDRTDDEIMASNLANQERQNLIREEQERRAEFRKELYRQLGRATGVDVDAMEREIARERAAEEAARQAAAEAAQARAREARIENE